MKMYEIRAATTKALSDAELPNTQYDSTLWGIALVGFNPVVTTFDVVAGFIRYQCVNFDGTLDSVALQEITPHLKRKVWIA